MKKLLLISALFIATSTTFATVQDDVAAVLAKTKYKNIMTFLGAVSIHPDFCANGIVYETDYPLWPTFGDSYIGDRSRFSDTVSLCEGGMYIYNYCTYYDNSGSSGYYDCDGEWEKWHDYDNYVTDTFLCIDGDLISYSYQNYVFYNDSLYYWGDCQGSYWMEESFPENKDSELYFIQLSYFKDKKVHIRYRRMVVRNTNNAQEIKVKYELIDNDIKGRAALTNLTIGDSIFFEYCDANYNYSEYKKFTKYLYFDTIPTVVHINNYYKGCKTDYYLYAGSATEMPRIHDTIIETVKDTVTVTDTIVQTIKDTVTVKDTIYITKTDTIYITKTDTVYITKTDTVYIEKEPNKTAIINKQTNLNVWPNPTTTFVNAEAEEPFSYTLLNNAGVILKKEEGEPSYTISMEEYPDGVYYIKTSDGVIRKIVKE